jgi:Ulp1 family protease
MIVQQVVLVCNTGDHWVVCRIQLDEWEITLYDSLPFPDVRVRELEPLTHLLPWVLAKTGYFDAKGVVARYDQLRVVSIPPSDLLVQPDVHSCGVFACMYIERMIGADFSTTPSAKDYREKIALEIFAHSVVVNG